MQWMEENVFKVSLQKFFKNLHGKRWTKVLLNMPKFKFLAHTPSTHLNRDPFVRY